MSFGGVIITGKSTYLINFFYLQLMVFDFASMKLMTGLVAQHDKTSFIRHPLTSTSVICAGNK